MERAKETAGASRPYHSPLRERQAEQTRESILAALAEVVAEAGTAEFSADDVAERAGVATRTLYRHFPNRQALLDGLSDLIDERMATLSRAEGGPDYKKVYSWAEIVEAVPWVFGAFDRLEPLTTALVLTSGPGRMRAAGHDLRTVELRRAVAAELASLDPEEAAAVFALCRHLISSLTWSVLTHEFGLDSETAGRTVARAVAAIIDQAAREAG